MPYIEISTDRNIPVDTGLVHEIVAHVAQVSGKDPKWVMVNLRGGESISLRGSEGNAFIRVIVVGTMSPQVRGELSRGLTDLASEHLKTKPDQTFIAFEELAGSQFACNGSLLG